MQGLLESAKQQAGAKVAFETACAISALTHGDIRGFRAHERAARGFLGVVVDQDLYTEWERRCLLAYRVCWTLCDDLHGDHHHRMVKLGWLMLECDKRNEYLVERAEALVECGWVKLEQW